MIRCRCPFTVALAKVEHVFVTIAVGQMNPHRHRHHPSAIEQHVNLPVVCRVGLEPRPGEDQ